MRANLLPIIILALRDFHSYKRKVAGLPTGIIDDDVVEFTLYINQIYGLTLHITQIKNTVGNFILEK